METLETTRSANPEAKDFIREIWYEFDYLLKRWRQGHQKLVPQEDQKTCERIFTLLGQLVAFLGGAEEAVADSFANDASELIQNASDLLSHKGLSIMGFERLENQIKKLIYRPPFVKEDKPFVGLLEDVQIVTSLLMEDRIVVSIVGVSGIGKTAVAKMVFENEIVVDKFPLRAWVKVPKDFEPTSVQVDIAMQVLPFEVLKTVYSTEKMIKALHRFLKKKRSLIVFDNLQTQKAWNILKTSLLDNLNGSRIMITTRNRGLLEAGLECRIFEKQALSDEDSWELFNSRVSSKVPDELEESWKRTVVKCMGLPAAICTAAADFSKKAATLQLIDHEQPMVVQEEINQDQSVGVEQITHDQTTVQPPINDEQELMQQTLASAAALPSNLKQCLHYFGMFHKDYEIPARRLIAYWVAEGKLTQEIGSLTEPPERVAEKVLTGLEEAGIVQVAKRKLNGKVKTCRMNYLLRDNWMSKAKKGTSSEDTGIYLRLADHFDNKDDCFLHIHGSDPIGGSSLKKNYGKLCSFLSFDSREGPLPGEDIGNFFRKCIAGGCFKMLQVVDLEGVFRPKLPNSIGKLTQLTYLGLRWTYLETLPSSVGNLLNLQTLDLKHTYISSLPIFLWKMKQLRHLYLSESYRSRFVPPPSTSQQIDIQTLWGAYLDDETQIVDGLDRLINLRKLGLACRLSLSEPNELAKWISKLDQLESLRLRSFSEMFQAADIYLEPLTDLQKLSSIYLFGRLVNQVIVSQFPKSLTDITLSLSGLTEDPMPALEKLPYLRILRLFASSYTGNIMHCSSIGFPLLRVLKLWNLELLEEWIVEKGAMKILREVEIRSCNMLRMIPDGFKYLFNCRELRITNMCDEFKARIDGIQGQDRQNIKHIPSVILENIEDKVTGLTHV